MKKRPLSCWNGLVFKRNYNVFKKKVNEEQAHFNEKLDDMLKDTQIKLDAVEPSKAKEAIDQGFKANSWETEINKNWWPFGAWV